MVHHKLVQHVCSCFTIYLRNRTPQRFSSIMVWYREQKCSVIYCENFTQFGYLWKSKENVCSIDEKVCSNLIFLFKCWLTDTEWMSRVTRKEVNAQRKQKKFLLTSHCVFLFYLTNRCFAPLGC